ncbi:DNA repair family protein-like protein [Xylariales sp. AK1849]|nr:DNA repair family protein-like protein [Xylariales sp. AK1849]
MSSKKRTLDAFFGVPKSNNGDKKPRHVSPLLSKNDGNEHFDDQVSNERIDTDHSDHPTYPFPIADLKASISTELPSLPSSIGRAINDQPDLDLLYFEPYIPSKTSQQLFNFLRSSLPFYRVEYDIKRGGISSHIRTPRWTTVFGLDETSRFASPSPSPSSSSPSFAPGEDIVDAKTGKRVVNDKYYSKYAPRPLPRCLDDLRRSCEAATGCAFNFCLVNYYASGSDSISFHSDDERFLGPEPAIASFSLGARRDFLLKHKPPPAPKDGQTIPEELVKAAGKPLKLPLPSGDMILMRGRTQANWLHSIPKRTGKNAEDGGRINITFRRAMVKGGTENYYNYNVGTGPVHKWDAASREMKPWNKPQ